MEIQYTKLNELKERVYSVHEYLPDNMYQGAFESFRRDEPDAFNGDDVRKLVESADRLLLLLNDDYFDALREEIEMNIVSISTDASVMRYLKHMQEQAIHLREMLEAQFDFESFRSEEDKIWEGYREGNWKRTGKAALGEFLAHIESQPHSSNNEYKYTEEEAVKYNYLKKNKDTVSYHGMGYLLQTYVYLIRECRDLVEEVTLKLDVIQNPDKPIEFSHDLIANTHRLVLLYKLGLFDTLYDQYYGHLGILKFTKLIATILGIPEDKHKSFKKSLSDFITETYLKKTQPKTVQTDTLEKKVNAFLTEIGLISPG
jgi:uncharacterized protein YozE (UPF0346 family)